jgi:prepilin-type N-terminal cleavage/methylation domain-containing protein
MTTPHPHPTSRRASARGGFSMVEMLVATVLLATGLLALAGTTGAVTDLMLQGTRETQASTAAQSRIEGLAGKNCADIVSGTSEGTYKETWTVSTIDTYTRKVRLTVIYSQMATKDTITYTTHLRCKTS